MQLNKKYYSTDFNIALTHLSVHKDSNAILQEAEYIAKRLGIYSDKFYNGHSTMTPYIFVDTNIERSVTATVWFSTLYYLDDFFGEDMRDNAHTPDFKALFTTWMSGQYDKNNLPEQSQPLFKAIAYCSQHIQQQSNPVFFQRYTKELYDHLLHSLHPVNYNTVEEYVNSRIHFGGMYPTIGMIEYVNDIYIHQALLQKCPALQQAIKDCLLIGVLSNDLISYHKEKHSQQNLLNAYLKTNTVTNLDEAIQKGLDLVNRCYRSFAKHSRLARKQLKVLSLTDIHTLTTYLEGLKQLIAASYHWQMSTNRYRSTANIFEDLKYPISEAVPMAI